MICQNCQQQQATTHVTRIVNGETAQLHLCASCAAKLGIGMSLGDFFGSFFSAAPAVHARAVVRCETCGASFDEIAHNGMAGCADCYQTFYEQLLPSLHRIHGKTRHAGKTPAALACQTESGEHSIESGAGKRAESNVTRRLEQLQRELSAAVDVQEFERAAQLRDAIKALEGTVSGDE